MIKIAARLRELGDRLNESIERDFQETFAAELKKHSLFTLAYEEFKHVCTASLTRVRSQVSGWQQVYLLHTGKCSSDMEGGVRFRGG